MSDVLRDASVPAFTDAKSGTGRMNLLMFGHLGLGGVWYSRHHLAVGLAHRHRVVLVDHPTELRHTALRPWRWPRPGRLVRDERGPERYSPPGWLPDVHRWPRIRRAFNRWRAQSLLGEIDSGPVPILYVWNPAWQEAVEPLGHLPLVYHAYDKYDHYTDVTTDEVGPRERWLAQRADFCIAASAKLGEYLREIGAREVHVLRHGVDTNRFQPGKPVPPALAAIARPRIGVVARLNEALDMETLLYVAKERPHWSLVLVGGDFFTHSAKHAQFRELCRLPNVHHMGQQPPESIPDWLSGMDVGLACYDLATWGPYNQPIKMYEYLACGLPVVSSDILAARELGALVECCDTPARWVSSIERALESRSSEAQQARVAFARSSGWEPRVAELEKLLQRLT